jgi:hypothetical protein
MRVLRDAAANLEGVQAHEWPFEEEADKAYYVETEDGKRYGVRVEEVARFQAGNTYF